MKPELPYFGPLDGLADLRSPVYDALSTAENGCAIHLLIYMVVTPHIVVGLGEALWDMLPTGKHLGGAPLNFAYIASLLGEHAMIASRIGNDSLGSEIQVEFGGRNLDLGGIQTDSNLRTGTVDVRFRDGQPEYEIRQPAAWDALEWTPKWREIASKCDAVCFGSLAQRAPKSRQTIQNFVENTRSECLRVFDINLRKPFYEREVIESSLHLASILKLNDLELPELAAILGLKGDSQQALMRELIDTFSLKTVLVTCGERGAMAAGEGKIASHPGFKVRVSDTIGAGDAFTAAAIHCILRGIDLEKTLAFANKWASWVASQAGGMPPIGDDQRLKMLSEVAAQAS